MVIDIHGHFTTTPPQVSEFRARQVEQFQRDGTILGDPPTVSDEEIRAGIEPNQLARMKERGVDLTLFSPKAVGMDHHQGNEATNVIWARYSNDLVDRVCRMFPSHFVGVGQLPQACGVPPRQAMFDELRRCVEELGFVGVNLNPDPTGGRWSDPPLWDKNWWYPLYEQLVQWRVPAMIHVSGSCNPHFNAVATHYINGDTTAFVQFLTSDIFKDFPQLKFILPHGGGAVPYHWGRYRGLAQDMGLPPLEDKVLGNVYFDTCVYHQPGIDLLLSVVPSKNILFASETLGAVNGIDPRTGHHYDHTRRYIDTSPSAAEVQRLQIYSENAQGVYPRLRPLC
ncbi:MAG: amidohydrolase family protein [Alphaproteobacteria bacterium]|nr:amidohydrolase family protein [Alphaproteobacteria bacterium]